MRGVEFHPEAAAALISAAKYPENHVEHLGLDFILAVRRTYLHRRPGYWRSCL